MSAFTAAQLLSAPLWGRFSDRYGRRPALLVGLTASCIAYVVFAFATSIWLLLLSRIVQGAGGGTVGVIQAYVADSVEPDRSREGARLAVRRDERRRCDRPAQSEVSRSGSAAADLASRPRAFVSSTFSSPGNSCANRAT